MATRTISNAGGNWSAVGTWVEGAVPTAADDVVATATSGPVTIDAAAACRSLDLTGYTSVLTHNAAITLTLGHTTARGDNVALLLPAGTYVAVNGQTSAITWASTVAGQTIRTNDQQMGNQAFAGAGGGWIVQDTFRWGTVTHTKGTLDINGQTGIMRSLVCSGANVRALTLGAATITFTSGNGGVWNLSGSNLTLSAALATLIFTAATVSFIGFGGAYGTARFTGTGVVDITGANTFATLERSNAAAVTLQLPAGVATAVTNLIASGAKAGTLLTIQSSIAATAATLTVAGAPRLNHASIKDIAVGGAGSVIAVDSINVSGNSGITFARGKALAAAGVG